MMAMASNPAIAQEITSWIGGTPGKENQWDEPRNWENNEVPDENTHVIITSKNTGHMSQPMIDGQVEVGSIKVYSGASLTIGHEGELIIDGEYVYSEGLVNLGGVIKNDGMISLSNIEDLTTEKLFTLLEGNGNLEFDGQLFSLRTLASK